MCLRHIHKYHKNKNTFFQEEGGFSLLLVLLFIGVVSGGFTAAFWSQSEQHISRQAYASGWHLVEVSKAARVFVRDAALTSVVLSSGVPCCTQTDVELQGGSIEVPFQDLIDSGHLSPLLVNENALGQSLRVFAASYPPVVNPAAQNEVIASYVITDTAVAGTRTDNIIGAKTSSALMLGARDSGLSASAPLVIAGAAFGDDCGGNPSVMIWDTGCLNQNDVDIITADAGGIAIDDGQVIVPTWRVLDHDMRALMRFPQPENPSANQMFTDLHLGDPVDFAANPDTAGVDNRVDLENVDSVTMSGLELANQGGPGAGVNDENETTLAFDMVAYNELVMAVGGNVTGINNMSLQVTHGAEVGQSVNTVGDIFVADGVSVEEDLNVAQDIRVIGNATSLTTQGNLTVGAEMVGLSTVTLTTLEGAGPGQAIPDVDMQPGNGFATAGIYTQAITGLEQFAVSDQGTVNVLNQIDMAGGTITVTGGAPLGGGFDARFGAIQGASGNITFNTATRPQFLGGGSFGASTMSGLHTNICNGQCPEETTNDGADVSP